MIYSSNPDGSANFALVPGEHASFKKGRSVVRPTADAYGEYQIVVKKVCVAHAYFITDLETGHTDIDYGGNIKKLVERHFGTDIKRYHGRNKNGIIIELHSGRRYGIKRRLRTPATR